MINTENNHKEIDSEHQLQNALNALSSVIVEKYLQFTANTNGFDYDPIIKVSIRDFYLTEKQQNPEDFWDLDPLMDTQSVITIATPFLVFGGVFAVLLLVWDRS